MWNFYTQNKNFKFTKLIINRKNKIWHNIKYFPQVFKLYISYLNYLEDDFSPIHENLLDGILNYIENSDFYLVLDNEEVCGFFALTNFIGSPKNLYSAEITTCFSKKYWGKYTKILSLNFKNYCFNNLKLKRIKALIYPQNTRTRGILRVCGFKKEATLFAETIRNGKPQNVEIFTATK